jgi:hypothetical protein
MSRVGFKYPIASLPLAVLVDTKFDDSSSTVYNFSSVNLGVEDASRRILIAAVGVGGNAIAVSGVTLDGAPMTQVAHANSGIGNVSGRMYHLPKAIGTTGTFSVTFGSSGKVSCAIYVYALYNAASSEFHQGQIQSNTSNNSITTTLNVPANGVVIGVLISGSANIATGSGLTGIGIQEAGSPLVFSDGSGAMVVGRDGPPTTAQTGRTVGFSWTNNVMVKRAMFVSWAPL